ncbi:hypothetical protein [Aliiruegeria sabulilitoris]|uniref:hypothetical protein n=1 Tax=Aliiruegeria sabulilitoris TaxID=1510458 RepID=UPI000835A7A5|nr:hypothetical protein [Aliiruegeria sabulilitoris]NDR57198.1 hypothetical protein [Pseudoruegeria sp. M32A2M]
MLRTLLIALLASVSPVWADVTAPSGRVIDCYCTDSTGDRVELGDVICLRVDGRMFLARCEMSLNNPMWREVQEGCTTSRLERLLQMGLASRNSGS